jgi:two-component system sensor histidine kinase MprB
VSLRRRITLVGAAAVAVAVVLACMIAYVAVRSELLGQVDDQLRQQGAAVRKVAEMVGNTELRPPTARGTAAQLTPQQGGPLAYVQALRPDGVPRTDVNTAADFAIPVDAVDREIAAGHRASVMRDAAAGDVQLRVFTVRLDSGLGALQFARPLDSIHTLLGRLRLILLLVCIGGVALAAALARIVTRRVTAPLRAVADAVDHIAQTDDLARRIAVSSDDEVGQLARRFNGMLDSLHASREALAGSVTAQRQLVADASHELRTPITSVRTNLEVLLEDEREQDDPLDQPARERLLADLIEQTEELSALVADVIELARGDVEPEAVEDVRLDEVTAQVVEQARRHHRDVIFVLDRSPVVLDGARDRLGRAVNNVLENAAKHSTPGQTVEVTVDATGVRVRDHGPGVTAEDLPYLFDRFYRGATARRLPGTGLGLAIVRQVAEGHGGSVHVSAPTGGGAEFHLELPARAVEPQLR